MTTKPMLFAIVGLAIFAMFAQAEYTKIKARIETTQAKIDELTDSTTATIELLRKSIKSLAERLVKQDAAKQVDAPTQVVSAVKPVIVMHSSDSCGPCRAWIANDKSNWEKAGWDVQVIKELDTKRGWPWYAITDRDGKSFEVDGPLTAAKFMAAKGGK